MTSFNFVIIAVMLIIYCKVVLSDDLIVDEPSSCKVFEPKLPQTRLKMYIFCEYEKSICSASINKKNNVTLQLVPLTIDFDSYSNKFSLNSLLKVDWSDAHFKWSPEDFDGITELWVETDQIWVPDLYVLNAADINSVSVSPSSSTCLVSYTGSIFCSLITGTTVYCTSDYENWPFEKQKCSIMITSYFTFSKCFNLNFSEDKILMDAYTPNQEWDIVNNSAFETKGDIKVTFEFHLKRYIGVMLTLYVIPIIVLMIFTLVILWIDVNSVERIALSSLNIICHLYCTYDFLWQIPVNGSQTPHLVTFYQNSLVICVFSLLLTVLLRKLEALTTSSPRWVSSLASFVLSFRLGRLFILNDEETKCFMETEEEDENNIESMQSAKIITKEENVWKRFSKIVECLCFFSISITYILMLLKIIPT